MEKQTRVHLIATDKDSNLYLDLMDNKLGYESLEKIKLDTILKPQHLYITDDSPIKEGDWVISSYNEVHQVTKNDGKEYLKTCRKIIATTDLSMSTPNPSGSKVTIPVPSISQQDIETIVKLYNDGGNWEDVKGEEELDMVEFHSSSQEEYNIKLSPEGNVVLSFEQPKHCKTPTQAIKVYTREEVVELITEMYQDASEPGDGFFKYYDNLGEWIKKNLK